MIGFGAQQRRDKRLALLLVMAELAVIVVAAYNIKLDHFGFHNGILSLLTSIIDILLCGWVIKIAYNLTRASGGRVVRRQRRSRSKDSSHHS